MIRVIKAQELYKKRPKDEVIYEGNNILEVMLLVRTTPPEQLLRFEVLGENDIWHTCSYYQYLRWVQTGQSQRFLDALFACDAFHFHAQVHIDYEGARSLGHFHSLDAAKLAVEKEYDWVDFYWGDDGFGGLTYEKDRLWTIEQVRL